MKDFIKKKTILGVFPMLSLTRIICIIGIIVLSVEIVALNAKLG